MADKASRKTSEESHARMRYTATRHGHSELPRTQKRYDLLQAQGAVRQAGQYDLDEVERLLTDGMRNIAGAERTADILSYSRDGELANTPVVLGRAAKGYTIPAGVYDVAATQQLLGVKADGMWGKNTDRAYKNLMSGGGQAPDNGQKVADALDGLYAQVNASGLNKAQKTRAIALLETLKLYGDAEYIRKTLLGIQMAGGAEKFFTTLSGPSGYALIDMQKKERQALQIRLAQTERAIADIPLWNRWVSPTPDYQELQREKAGLQERIGAVEARLSEISPDWETVWDIWDWSEVDAWEKEQEETAQRAESEAYRKQLESLVYPDALPTENIPRYIEELEISDKAIEVFIDREGNESYLRATGIGQFDKNGKLIGIYPHYANDGGVTLGYGHRITQKALKLEPEQAALYEKYAPGAAFNGAQGTKVPWGVPMPIEEAHALMLKDIEFYKNRLIGELKERNALQKVRLTQQEFDALMLVSFNEGNVRTVYDLLINNNRDRSEWQDWWDENDERESIALDIFFNGEYERRRE